MKRLASLLLSALLVFSLTACGNPAGKGEAETDEFLSQLEGSYVELFPELGKDEYHEKWVTHVEPIVGEAATEETIAFLLNMCTAEIYGDEAVEAYKNPDDMRFDCYFLGGVDKFTISGNVISGVDENGKEVFSHTYSPFENTYHIEFRYAESVDDLQSWFEGSYAYWNAAGILEGYSDEMMDQCIELFATENLSGE